MTFEYSPMPAVLAIGIAIAVPRRHGGQKLTVSKAFQSATVKAAVTDVVVKNSP